jgi:N-acetylmuramoyl-L-alanine amidase
MKREILSLHGVDYVPLITLCRSERIDWEWDPLARVVTLSSVDNQIKLLVGSSSILVNNEAKQIRHPVELYQGMVVIPVSFIPQLKYLLKIPPLEKEFVGVHKLRKIVIDPGHGGSDPGAIGKSGLIEKDVVLDIAKRLKQALEKESIEVILTRDSDEFISLWKRAQIANSQNADLFISIHANASRSKSLQGFEVYYLSERTDDYARALAAAENAAFAFEGEVVDSPSTDLKATLWDIIFSENREESIELAKDICKTVVKETEVKTKRIRGAPFYVLKRTQMPSILIEMGYLSNPTEEARLGNSFYRQKLTEAIVSGVLEYKREYERTDGFTR